MDKTQTEIYHAWLRQQLEVSDIREGDFDDSQMYFDHKIAWALEYPTEMVKTAYRTYINAVASQVAHDMDGTQINSLRLHTGKSYRREIIQRYIQDGRQESKALPGAFIYGPYSGITSDVSTDWTQGYNGIVPMGHFNSHPSEAERDAALIDQETGKRWPENETWAVSEEEMLYHLFRMKQYNHAERWAVGCASEPCDRIYLKCDHQVLLDKALDEEWKRFIDWQDSQNPEEA